MNSNKNRIFHLLSSNSFSGAENVVCQIINLLKEKYDFYYVCPKGQIEESLRERNINYIPVESFNIKCIRKVLKYYKPHILHAHDISASVLACAATIGLDIKVISHVHVNNNNMRFFNKKTLLYFISSFRFRHIFWVSPSCYEFFFFKNMVKNKSTILPNVMNYEDIIRRAKIDDSAIGYDVVYVGRITYQKNPERLINVMKKLKEMKPDISMAIVGDGDLFKNTKELSEEYGLNNNLVFYGFHSHPLGILSKSKVMIMTSRFEGLPMTVLEAMALGIPVVSTPVDGLKDIIEPGVEGYLDDSDADIVSHIYELINNEGMRTDMSNNAKAKFNTICDLTRYRNIIDQIYTRK